MKPYLFLVLFLFLLFTGCSDDSKTTATNPGDGNITEATLPKGKYIVEDVHTAKNITTDPNPGSTNDYQGNKTNTNITPVENATDPTENLKRRYKNLLVFHADDTMKIKKAYIATLVLGKDQVLSAVKEEVLENSSANDNNIKQDTTIDIGNKMRARLIDMSGATNKGFEIELIGGEEAATQSITETHKKAIWSWKLIPQTPGLQNLKLSISIIEKDGSPVTLPTRSIPIVIFAEKESFFSQVGDFFADPNGKWLFTAILIPILIAWFTTRMKHKSEASRFANSNTHSNTPPAKTSEPTNTTAMNTMFRKNRRRK